MGICGSKDAKQNSKTIGGEMHNFDAKKVFTYQIRYTKTDKTMLSKATSVIQRNYPNSILVEDPVDNLGIFQITVNGTSIYCRQSGDGNYTDEKRSILLNRLYAQVEGDGGNTIAKQDML